MQASRANNNVELGESSRRSSVVQTRGSPSLHSFIFKTFDSMPIPLFDRFYFRSFHVSHDWKILSSHQLTFCLLFFSRTCSLPNGQLKTGAETFQALALTAADSAASQNSGGRHGNRGTDAAKTFNAGDLERCSRSLRSSIGHSHRLEADLDAARSKERACQVRVRADF